MFGGIKQSSQLDSTCCENCSNLFTGASKVSRKRYGHVIEFSRNIGEMYQSANRGCPFCTLLSTYNHQFTPKDWERTYPFEIMLTYKNETATHSYDVRVAQREDDNQCIDISRLTIVAEIDERRVPCSDILVAANPSTYGSINL
jgi:hypothetical protein